MNTPDLTRYVLRSRRIGKFRAYPSAASSYTPHLHEARIFVGIRTARLEHCDYSEECVRLDSLTAAAYSSPAGWATVPT